MFRAAYLVVLSDCPFADPTHNVVLAEKDDTRQIRPMLNARY